MDNTASCMIEVCDLHKHYKDVHVLRGISTTVAKGEVCAVIGPSGSGKSTFLRCLNRLEEASSGEIFINAQEITDPHLNLNKMRENIGMVFQGFNLFPHMTAIQNIMLAAPTTHFVELSQAILYRGAGIGVVWKPFLALALIGSALFALALTRFRRTISQMA